MDHRLFTLILFYIMIGHVGFSQCPTVDFSVPDTVCVNEKIEFINSSTNGTNYFWYLCDDQLRQEDTSKQLSNNNAFRASYGFDIIKTDSLTFGLTLRNAGLLYRIDFSDSINEITSIYNYPDERSNFDLPRDIRIIKSNNTWIGLATNSGSMNLTRINFGGSLDNDPSYDNIADITAITNTSGLEIIKDNGNFYALAGKDATNEIYVLDFQDDLLNTPSVTSFTIPEATGIQGISMVKDCNTWIGLATSISNDKLFRLIFNSGITNAPEITEITVSDTSFISPAKVKTVVENGHFYGFVQTDGGDLFRFNFGSTISNSPEITRIPATTDNGYAVNLAEKYDQWHLYVVDYINLTKGLYHLSFNNNCPLENHSFTEFEPENVSIDTPGTYPVSLTVYDENGNFANMTKELVVVDQEAPEIDFITDGNVCVEGVTEFNGQSSASITSWNWEFGDTGTASGQTVSHQYASAGDYPVTLSVEAENGCSNFTRDTVRIYDPPVPDFTITDSLLCSNKTLTLQNQTTYTSPDSITTFMWDINGEATSNQKDTVYTFASGGEKAITLTASIPGCPADTTKTFNIIEGPVVDFTFQDVCDTEPASFVNNSTGDIVRYDWDFGDGYVSNLESPDHLYDTTGTFEVSLLVTNDTGCVNQKIDTITVHHLPLADFSYELPCAENEIRFYDESTVLQANITEWNWFYGSQADPEYNGTDTLQNPTFIFPEPGNYEISLIAFSNYGCFDTVQNTVEALPSPEVGFDFVSGCLGDTIHFSDLSTMAGEDTLDSWTWQIDEEMYFTQNPNHVFKQSGEYEINLTVHASNRCENSSSKSLTIDPLPTADFFSENQCLNEPILFVSTATSPPDPILNYVWNITGVEEKTGPEISHRFDVAGDYEMVHSVITEKGCRDSVSQMLTIYNPPEASFDFHPKFGAVPFEVTFENNSTLADQYQWDFDDGTEKSTEANPVHIYQETGSYEPQLVAGNQWGCVDSTSVLINVVPPVLDVRIDNIRSEVVNGRSSYVLEITNEGTVIIDDMDILISIDGEYTVSEMFTDTLYANGSVFYRLDFELYNLPNQQPELICFELIPHLPGYEELKTYDNRECLSRDNRYFIRNMYPNPARDRVQLDIMLPEEDEITLQLLSRNGKTLWTRKFDDTKTGLNQLIFDMGENPQGIYLLRIFYRDDVTLKRISIIR